MEKRMAKLLSDASRSRSELKAAHESGSKKKKSEKRDEGETSSPPKSNRLSNPPIRQNLLGGFARSVSDQQYRIRQYRFSQTFNKPSR